MSVTVTMRAAAVSRANVPAGTRPRQPGEPFDTPTAVCALCESRCADNELKPMVDLYLRVSAGEEMPVGACPWCGGLCHRIEELAARAVPVELRQTFWTPFPKHIALDGELIPCTASATHFMLFLIQNLTDLQVKALVMRAIEVAQSERLRLSAIHLDRAHLERHDNLEKASGSEYQG